MKTLVNSIFRFTLSLLLLTGYSHAKANSRPTATTHLVSTNTFSLARTRAIRTALSIYQEMNLGAAGLNEEAFEYAYVGYERLRKRRLLHKTTVLSVCDFSQASSEERMYVIDLLNKKLLYRTYVAHGINSGKEYANSFSNRQNSYKSSLGFYITRQSYYGDNGLSLRIQGMDKGFNDMAGRRNIVIHGAPYVSTRILKKYGVMGTTYGCPAIPEDMSSTIIPVIKKGTCFFIYYPSQRYLSASSVLNG
ncbi:MAG TPA: murein L,D-transpeptidase catalytic domain family protein [Puia sp.]|nr:murein L,D-transpeptidase catalytic domain family protein [Puia sp.]